MRAVGLMQHGGPREWYHRAEAQASMQAYVFEPERDEAEERSSA